MDAREQRAATVESGSRDAPSKLIIKGKTRAGRKFRPSDWAQRLTTAAGRVDRNGRIRFHPHVHMATLDGVNCVVVDTRLADEDPMLFHFLVSFAEDNDLETEQTPTETAAPAP